MTQSCGTSPYTALYLLECQIIFFHLSITTVSPSFSINRVCRVRLVGNCSSKGHPGYIHHLWRRDPPISGPVLQYNLSTLSLAFPVASFQAATIFSTCLYSMSLMVELFSISHLKGLFVSHWDTSHCISNFVLLDNKNKLKGQTCKQHEQIKFWPVGSRKINTFKEGRGSQKHLLSVGES